MQSGGALNVYRGVAGQKGRGFSFLLGGLKNILIPLAKIGVKAAVPVLRRAGRAAARRGARQLVQVAKDVGRGKPLKQAVVSRVVKPTMREAQKQLVRRLVPAQRKRKRKQPSSTAAQGVKKARLILA